MQKKRKFRTASQLLLIGLLTAATTLPGFTTAISVSADEAIHQESETTRLLKEEGDIASGISGSSKWRIDSTGILYFQPGILGEDKEWKKYSSQINKIIFEGNIQPPENLKGYFSGLSKVKNIEGLYRLDTSNVTDMSNMFSGMSSLSSLDLSGLDTSNVTDMSSMFLNMSSLTSLDLSDLDTSNVTDMTSMFSGMSNLSSLDLSGLDTSNVTDMSSMFYGMSNLSSLDLSSLDTSNVTDMHAMFYGMTNLSGLDLSGLDTSNVTDMRHMFSGMRSLTSLDLSSFDTSNVTDMYSMFSDMSNLSSLNLSSFNTSNVTLMAMMFHGVSSLTNLDLSSFNTSSVRATGYMFENMSSLTSLDLSGFDTSNVTAMGGMFSGMTNLSSLDLSSFNTSNVTHMFYMFRNTTSLTEVDVSSFDTSSVVDMVEMFLGSGLESLNLSNFDTSKVVWDSFLDMFFGMKSLRSLDISSFKASKVALWGNPMLSQITLGSDVGDVVLADIPKVEKYSGKWINIGKGTVDVPKGVNVWTSAEFLSNYNGSKHADTYVWQKDLTAVNVHDSTLQVGDTWTAEDNFDSAMTSDGYNVKFKDISVTGEVDTSQASEYPVQYSYNGVTETVTVTVKEADPIQGGDVTVHYQDTEGNTISDDVVLKGNVGESYTSEKKSIKGYTYKETKGNASGKFKDESQTVTYVYTSEKKIEADTKISELSLGSDTLTLSTAPFIEEVRFDGKALSTDEYTAKVTKRPDTSKTGNQVFEIRVSLVNDKEIFIDVPATAHVTWGSTLVVEDYAQTAVDASVSLLDNKGIPTLNANQGFGVSNPAITSGPSFGVFRGDTTHEVLKTSINSWTETPQDLSKRWNETFASTSLKYGDVAVLTVDKWGGAENWHGADTFISRDEKLVKETEGYDDAYYELTQSGYRLLHLNQLTVNKDKHIPLGTTKEEMDKNISDYITLPEMIEKPENYRMEFGSVETKSSGKKTSTINVYEKLESDGEFMKSYNIDYVVDPAVTEYYYDTDANLLEAATKTDFEHGTNFEPNPAKHREIENTLYVYKGWSEEKPDTENFALQEGIPTSTSEEKTYYYIYEKADKLINVTLPTEIVFGTYEDSKVVTSKDYSVKNNSSEVDLEIDLLSFDKVKSDVQLLDKDAPTPTEKETSARLDLMVGDKAVIPGLTESTDEQKLVSLSSGQSSSLGISGTYFGESSERHKVEYEMQLKFKAQVNNKK